ncbi:MAG: hypothetical protein D4R48_01155 [Nitrosomonadales bacterium]|nr:MAG: hypothetical protein D4R48_01155 [Nitrosomonadales bacterium]
MATFSFGFAPMFNLKRTALLLVLLLPCALHAAQWREVPSTIPNIIVYIDPSSISVTDYVVKGWVRFDYRVPQEYQGKQLIGESSERMVNCRERTFWVMDGYGQPKGGGDPIRVYSTAEYWTTPAPDSRDEAAYTALCEESKSLIGNIVDKAGEALDKIAK